MNIFDIYLDKIKKLAIKLNKENVIEIPESLNGINVNVPPSQFDCDISTNVAMVLSKLNKKSPIDLANQLSELIKKDDKNIYSINVAKPGFINIKFEGSFWNNFLKEIIDNHKTFGVNKKQKKHKYLVEFVSANPTGPLHVGHCRGAVIGDVISNILSFNQHKVTKEYYVNDHGNQIISFTKSVYLRILLANLRKSTSSKTRFQCHKQANSGAASSLGRTRCQGVAVMGGKSAPPRWSISQANASRSRRPA